MAPAAWQVPIVPAVSLSPTHESAAWQGFFPVRHAPPEATYEAQVPDVAPVGMAQARLRPQSAWSWHRVPGVGTAAQVPQFSYWVTSQKVLWHCPLAPQGAPFAWLPDGGMQAAGGLPSKKSTHW